MGFMHHASNLLPKQAELEWNEEKFLCTETTIPSAPSFSFFSWNWHTRRCTIEEWRASSRSLNNSNMHTFVWFTPSPLVPVAQHSMIWHCIRRWFLYTRHDKSLLFYFQKDYFFPASRYEANGKNFGNASRLDIFVPNAVDDLFSACYGSPWSFFYLNNVRITCFVRISPFEYSFEWHCWRDSSDFVTWFSTEKYLNWCLSTGHCILRFCSFPINS